MNNTQKIERIIKAGYVVNKISSKEISAEKKEEKYEGKVHYVHKSIFYY